MDVDRIELVKAQLQPYLLQFESYVRRGEEFVSQIPPTQIYIAIGVVLFTVFFFLLSNFSLTLFRLLY